MGSWLIGHLYIDAENHPIYSRIQLDKELHGQRLSILKKVSPSLIALELVARRLNSPEGRVLLSLFEEQVTALGMSIHPIIYPGAVVQSIYDPHYHQGLNGQRLSIGEACTVVSSCLVIGNSENITVIYPANVIKA